MPRRSEVGLVYATGLVQGLALVTFPAASSIFTSPDGYGFSASRYGMMFVPQVVLAILASSLGPRLARRWSLKRVLQAGMSADLLAMLLLALSRVLQSAPAAAYGILLVATGALGFGFGTVVMALNTYAEEFSPGREDRAVLSLNALLGAGTALAPLLVAVFTGLGAWWLLPLTVAAAMAGSASVQRTAAAGGVGRWGGGHGKVAAPATALRAVCSRRSALRDRRDAEWQLVGTLSHARARRLGRRGLPGACCILGDGHRRTNSVRRCLLEDDGGLDLRGPAGAVDRGVPDDFARPR